MASRPSDIEKAFSRAVVRAVNRMIVTGRAAATRQVRKIYNVKAGDLKNATTIYRASSSRKEALLVIQGRRMAVILFDARHRRTAKGATVRIKKSEGRKLIRSTFIVSMSSGKRHVWKRVGKERLPIKPLFTVSPPKMFEVEGEKAFKEIIEKEFGKTFENELSFQLSRTP